MPLMNNKVEYIPQRMACPNAFVYQWLCWLAWIKLWRKQSFGGINVEIWKYSRIFKPRSHDYHIVWDLLWSRTWPTIDNRFVVLCRSTSISIKRFVRYLCVSKHMYLSTTTVIELIMYPQYLIAVCSIQSVIQEWNVGQKYRPYATFFIWYRHTN